jgi:hypothetical protein
MEGFLKSNGLGQQIGRAKTAQELGQQYQLGTPQERQATLGQLAQYDPQQAQFLQQQQVAQQAQQEKNLQRMGRFGQGAKASLAKADPKQRNSVYKAYLNLAEQSGMDISDAPQEYGEEAEQYIDTVIGMTTEPQERKVLKDVTGRQRYKDTGELVFPSITQTETPEERAKKEKVLFDKGTTLRKEFTANSADFVKIRDAHNRVKASAQDPSAAGDLALIFNYMKVLDPGSVVRESEFATAANAAGVPDRVRNIWNKARRGTRLALDQRKDFVDRSDKLFNAQLSSQKRLINKFGTIADRAGVDRQDVLLEFASETPEAVEAVKEVEGQQVTSPEGQTTAISEGRTMTNQKTGERFVVRGGVWSKV